MTVDRPIGNASSKREAEKIRRLVERALDNVGDPEMPAVSLSELGMVHEIRIVEADRSFRVEIDLLPTFVGCPALELMRREVERTVRPIPGVVQVEVRFVSHPRWTTDRIRPSARPKLEAYGIAPPPCLTVRSPAPAPDEAPPPNGAPAPAEATVAVGASVEWNPRCPYCGSEDTILENPFGPTSCRSIFYCRSCLNPFEAMKPLGVPVVLQRRP
ncbi:hypothetical protein SA87_08100 [Hydrogenibacillus schlegelii]|uniref:Uncharacterized protein n=2 Tax=Hydrogenibacillus schlegelii TaxID=1484 RepID=A0A179ITV7_HYDSH|nr:hypothetical protein SA87_08100 [Hydrogenibacillus schlegelii]